MTFRFEQAKKLASSEPTPFVLVELDSIRSKYNWLREVFRDEISIYYAMKANPLKEILEVLWDQRCGFEVTSRRELEQLLEIGVSVNKIISLNPIKTPDFISFAYQMGMDIFAFDSLTEVEKIHSGAPHSKVVLRITVDNTGSDWPLTRKFGVSASQAIELLKYAKKKDLVPYGLTFHVGSQCLNISNWPNALFACLRIWCDAQREGIKLKMLSLGGGLPVKHTKSIPEMQEVAAAIRGVIDNNFTGDDIVCTIEPGRSIVGDSAILVSSVIGKGERGKEKWIYLDVGVFNGLMESIAGFKYEVKTERAEIRGVFTLAGPSCDSVDIIMENIPLPELQVGDKVYFLNAGAYTLSYASNFNGFSPPQVYFVN